jgi:hypothetical protein
MTERLRYNEIVNQNLDNIFVGFAEAVELDATKFFDVEFVGHCFRVPLECLVKPDVIVSSSCQTPESAG